MISPSFISQFSESEFDENVANDYIYGFKEDDTEYNMKRVVIAALSPSNSLLSEEVFEECEQSIEESDESNDSPLQVSSRNISFNSELQDNEAGESTCKSDKSDLDSCDFTNKSINDSKVETNSESTNDDACFEDKLSKLNISEDKHDVGSKNKSCFNYNQTEKKSINSKIVKQNVNKNKTYIQRSRARPSDIKNYCSSTKRI